MVPEQAERLRGRGDAEEKVKARIAKATEEVEMAVSLGCELIINDDLERAVVQLEDMSEASPELAQELIDWCREKISAVKCPRSVDFDAELPRHPTGKLYKRLLKDRYWGKRDSRIV